MVVLGSLVAALIPLLLALIGVARHDRAARALRASASLRTPSIMEVILLIGLAVGVDYSLFYMRREREERARRPQRAGRAGGRRRDLGPRRPGLRASR